MRYGVNGDPLADGKLDLPELLEKPGSDDRAWARNFVAQRSWREAVTKVRHIYWAVDEFKYWTMGWPVEETTVIDRARVDAPEPWKEA